MSSVVPALLVNCEAFLADDGVRRSVGMFSMNYTRPDAAFNTTQITLNPGQSTTILVPGQGTAALMMRTTAPVRAEFTTEDGSFGFVVSKSLVLDQPVTQAIISNEGTSAARIVVIQC